MKYFFLLASILFSFHLSFSQVKQGVVFDADTQEPLTGAVIQYASGSTLSDNGGHFTVPSSARSIECTHIGYKPVKLNVNKGTRIALSAINPNYRKLYLPPTGRLQNVPEAPIAINSISSKTINEAKTHSIIRGDQ